MGQTARLAVYFNDGTHMDFIIPEFGSDEQNMAAVRMRERLEKDGLAVEVGGDLLIIAKQSIKYIRLSPAPHQLPNTVITGAAIIPQAAGTAETARR